MRIGVDIVEINRIEKAAQREGFPESILSPQELEIYNNYSNKRKMTFLAGRFSVKEAYAKALGTGIGHWLRFNHISVEADQLGAPIVTQGPITKEAKVSLSHSKHDAIGMCLIELSDTEIEEKIKNYRNKLGDKK